MKDYPDVKTGQVWLDRDKRMMGGNRRVIVVDMFIDNAWARVKYRAAVGNNDRPMGPLFISRYDRFQRAFTLVSEP